MPEVCKEPQVSVRSVIKCIMCMWCLVFFTGNNQSGMLMTSLIMYICCHLAIVFMYAQGLDKIKENAEETDDISMNMNLHLP